MGQKPNILSVWLFQVGSFWQNYDRAALKHHIKDKHFHSVILRNSREPLWKLIQGI